VLGLGFAPITILLEIDFAIDAFFIFLIPGRPIVRALALGTIQFN